MPTPPRLDAAALASELAKLPILTAPASAHLDPVHIAIARAVASGQDAAQLAADLSSPIAWRGIDLSQIPAGPRPGVVIHEQFNQPKIETSLQKLLASRRQPAKTTAVAEKPREIAPQAQASAPDPLGSQLGSQRILRVSPLTAVRAIR